MPSIVVLQRTTDGGAVTARIVQSLVTRYGKDAVAVDQGDRAASGKARSGVLIVVVGSRWLGPIVDGRAAIHQPSDAVRCRIEAALRSGEPIVPVAVGGARLPRAAELPESLGEFAARPLIEIDAGRNFSAQVAQLIETIDRHRGAAGRIASAPEPPVPANEGAPSARAAAAAPSRAESAPSGAGDRSAAEYWLRYAETERRLAAGDSPLIMVSYANEDLEWVNDLQAFIDPKLEHLCDPDGQPYRLWQFSNPDGAALGEEFPAIIAEKMWRCRVAIVVLSKAYFSSIFCRQIELPFLIWRREHHGLFCIPLRLGPLPIDRVRLPAHNAPARSVFVDALVDDRQAAIDFATSPYRDFNLKQLREKGLESEIESRFDGIARLIVDFLRKCHAAADC